METENELLLELLTPREKKSWGIREMEIYRDPSSRLLRWRVSFGICGKASCRGRRGGVGLRPTAILILSFRFGGEGGSVNYRPLEGGGERLSRPRL